MKIKINKVAEQKLHTGSVYAINQGSKEDIIFSASADRLILEWNLEALQFKKHIASLPATVYSLCYIQEKNLLLGGTANGTIHVLDLEANKEILILDDPISQVFDIQYSIENNRLFTVDGSGNFWIYSLDDFTLLWVERLGEERIRSMAFNENTSEMALALGNGDICIFDIHNFERKITFTAHEIASYRLMFSPNKELLFSAGRDAQLNIWNTSDNSLVKTIPAHERAIYDIAFHPNESLFATASIDKSIKIWDAKSFELLEVIDNENYEGHIHSVNKLLWSKYHNYLISTGDDRRIILWDVSINDSI